MGGKGRRSLRRIKRLMWPKLIWSLMEQGPLGGEKKSATGAGVQREKEPRQNQKRALETGERAITEEDGL